MMRLDDASAARLAAALEQVRRREITAADLRERWGVSPRVATATLARWQQPRPVDTRRPWHTDEAPPRRRVRAWRVRREARMLALAEHVAAVLSLLLRAEG